LAVSSIDLIPGLPFVSWCLCGERSEKAFHHKGTKTQRGRKECLNEVASRS
jgi:hypothetical protein